MIVNANTNPDLRAVLDVLEREIKLTFNCHAVGKIEQFFPSTQTAQVSILYKRGLYDSKKNKYYKDYPLIGDVPVVQLSGGAAGISMPIAAGDECILLFNDRDIDNWYATGSNAPLATSRLHAFTDAFALVGVKSKAKQLASYDPVRAVLYNGTTIVGVGQSLVKIANNQYTLGTLLNNLCTQLNSLTTAIAAITVSGVQTGAGVSGPPANATAISNIGTQISQIATQLQGLLE